MFAFQTLVYLFVLVPMTSCQIINKLQYRTYEEEGINVFIGNAGTDSGLRMRNDFDDLKFQLFTAGNENTKYLHVDQQTGVIRTEKNIDRETICTRTPNCTITFDVAVYKNSSNSLVIILGVTLWIDDKNDNSPKFLRKVVDLKVAENNEVGHILYTSVATDDDAEGINSRLTYKFETPSDIFELSTMKTSDGLEDLVITIKRSLDRETKSLYNLTVVATDFGDPPRNGNALINIVVTDVNDNTPVFTQTSYVADVLENSDKTIPVITVSASDADDGDNARLTFSLSGQVTNDIKNMFVVDENSGKIFSRQPLDYEAKRKYQFYVTASDNGSPSRSSQTYVTVNVIDVNDNPPLIDVTLYGDSIEENGSIGKYVGMVKVSDADSMSQGKISCNVEDTHFNISTINHDMGLYQIKLSMELDREMSPTSTVTVVIVCQDGDDTRPLTSSASITVTVLDLNDNRPEFRESSLYGSVMENSDHHTSVMQVEAADKDEGENKRVTYSLSAGQSDGLFTIDTNSGIISTLQALDREVKQEYRLEVVASDNGIPSLAATSTVTVKVLDENDNPPKFRKQAYFNFISENVRPGSPAGDVPAYDLDSTENGRFLFTIIDEPGSEDGIFFTIDPDTGLIKSDKTFDRESKKTYTFRVKVSDPKIPSFFDTANVTVTITDDNDHLPFVIQPPPDARTFYCAFNLTVGYVVTTIISSDEDDPKSVEISYDIVQQVTLKQNSPLFSIDQYTGKLRIARQITPDDVATHLLVISVRDGSDSKAKTTTLNLTIVVEPGSEEAMRALKNADSAKTNNMVIAVIIVTATVVVAIFIIAIICLLRRNDKKRKPFPPKHSSSEAKMYQAAKWVSSVSIHNDVGPDDVKSTLEVPSEKKKKKEVSFSLDDEVVESHDLSGSIASSYSPSQKATHQNGITYKPTKKEEFIVLNGIAQPDYSQHLYDTYVLPSTDNPYEQQYMEVSRQTEDRYSDASSGDTGTSDSGRGMSEDESHGHVVDGDPKKVQSAPAHGIGVYHQTHAVSDHEDIPGSPTPMLSEADKIQAHHCYIRSSFDKLPAHGLGYPSGTSTRSTPSPQTNSQPRLTGLKPDIVDKSKPADPQVLQTFSSPYATGIPTNSTHPAWRRAKGLDTSWRSNNSSTSRLDDEDNTTTSGSYIISPDDLKENMYNHDFMV